MFTIISTLQSNGEQKKLRGPQPGEQEVAAAKTIQEFFRVCFAGSSRVIDVAVRAGRSLRWLCGHSIFFIASYDAAQTTQIP